MRIIVGHANMDLDSLASIVLARYLYPDHLAVRPGRVHPAARNLLNLYGDKLRLAAVADLKGQRIERMLVVDTRAADRVEEYFKAADCSGAEIEVWDHHPPSARDLKGIILHDRQYGANATQLGAELKARGLAVSPEDATIALSGIYADTGNFTHDNVAPEDHEVAAWLLSQGASLKLVKDFTVPLRDREQVRLFHEMLSRLEARTVNGHLVQACFLELEEDCQGLGAVVERVFEIENGELLFGLFWIKPASRMLIIGRNCASDVRLDEIMADFGGGGHAQAASATVRTDAGLELAGRFFMWLMKSLAPAAIAADIMTREPKTLSPDMSLVDASRYLESVSHSGAPVVDGSGALVGMLTLWDIMKGRKAGQMHVPLRGFMARNLRVSSPTATVREIDALFFEENIGHLPVVEDGRLVGIVTRTDLLDYKRDDRKARARRLCELGVAVDAEGVAERAHGDGGRETPGLSRPESWHLESEACD